MLQRISIPTLALAVVVLVGCGGPFVRVSQRVDLAEPWEDYERLVIQTRNGYVELLSGGTEEIRISGVKRAGGATIGEARENLAQLAIVSGPDEVDPATFVIAVELPDGLHRKSVGVSLDVRVPERCAAEIKTGNGHVRAEGLKDHAVLRTNNGSIRVEDVQGRVEAVTHNGRVRAENITGDLEVETGNGRIVADEIAGDCHLTSSNGRVQVRRADGSVQVMTSNGSIYVEATPPPDGQVVLETSNGSIRAVLPSTLRGQLSLLAGNGGIDADLDKAITLSRPRWSTHAFEAELNGGGDGRIQLRTSNGSVALSCR